LKLDQYWAYCVDLPAGFGGPNLSASALAVSPDGTRLYVVDRSVRQLVEIDTTTLAITRSAAVPLTAPASATSLVVGGDGRLYVSDGPAIVVVRTDTLRVAARWPMPGSVTGLAVASDGHGVVASTPQQVYGLASGGSRRSSTPMPADATAISRLLA
jgi:sugar lactone lactonase YvrE